MFNKNAKKKKSIQKNLLLSFLIAIVISIIVSIIGYQLFVKNRAVEKLEGLNVYDTEMLEEVSEIIKVCFALIACNAIFLSAFSIWIISKKMVQPIKKITEATKKVASGYFNIELETVRQDEIGELTNNFNQMVKDLASTENLQKEFIDNVSHEIKTPISSIQGFAKLLKDENVSKEEKMEYSQIIIEESDRLLNISNNMLKLSKLQNQNKILKREQIDIAEQIRRTISLLEPKWSNKEIAFNISMEEKYFYGDEDLIFQVWVNLIDNAIKFSKEHGKIEILLKENNENIVVEIKDNGMGMSEEDKKRIFTRFYQIDKSHSEEGCGLGLAIVKRIIELSNGTIKIISEENKGTTMIVKLPIEKNNNKIVIV